MINSFPDFLDEPSEDVAPRLLGCYLSKYLNDGQILRFKIVETESYHQLDEASHSYKGISPKNEVMFGPSGNLYVYFTYGMHYCCNIVTDKNDYGSAVLLRALEPDEVTKKYLVKLFPNKPVHKITNGPAKICKVLGIDKTFNGHNLRQKPLVLSIGENIESKDIVLSARVGISRAVDEPLRFYIKDNPFISKK
jgi:DNA-3-methyladenine glycosylase